MKVTTFDLDEARRLTGEEYPEIDWPALYEQWRAQGFMDVDILDRTYRV